ncbi:hypothetical protein V3C99_007274 [Haemonchus contortus]|uniref:G_PROTEIN_RECEP_F1_2 domain-containing protein n=1 Tax=Haemonchus contortus TaxID=6289 RepID=A0A7I4YNQ8_HAECO
MEAMIFSSNISELYMLCSITAPISDKSRKTIFLVIFLIYILVLICYLLLVILLKKTRLSHGGSKQIYRSVAVISVTMVLGYFSAGAITVCDIIFDLNIDKFDLFLFIGVLINSSCATNFFVYYFISRMYRREFDQYLFIGNLKEVFSCKQISRTHVWATAPNP